MNHPGCPYLMKNFVSFEKNALLYLPLPLSPSLPPFKGGKEGKKKKGGAKKKTSFSV